MQQGGLGRLRDLLHEPDDAGDDGLLEVEPPLLSEEVGEEAHDDAVPGGVGKAELLQALDHGDLVLVRDVG